METREKGGRMKIEEGRKNEETKKQKMLVTKNRMNHPAASGRGDSFCFTRIYSHRRAVGYLPS